ncbi:hypothetical protein JW756_00940 [Candidatus Woesearchaeota archaeon]|nr:hypothetical protein [Candidatus Woesearchaeota archaeon]
MRKIFFSIALLAMFSLVFSLSSAEKVADANGTMSISNDNGEINASMSNVLTVIFNLPTTSSSGGGGGGGGFIDPYNFTKPVAPVIEYLDDLLSTVKPSDLGFSTLSTDKMKAEQTNNFLTTSKLDYSALSLWTAYVKDSGSKEEINSIVNELKTGLMDTVSVEHKSEVFKIRSTYSNVANYTNRTRVTITIIPTQDITNVRVLEFIPKSIASSDSMIVFTDLSDNPVVLEKDPLIEWTIPSIRQGETKAIIYYIKGATTKDDFKTIVSYEKQKPSEPTGGVITEPEPQPEEEYPLEEEEFEKPGNFQIIWPIIIIIILGALIGGYVVYKKQADAKQALLLKQKLAPKDLVIRSDIVIPYDKVRGVEKFIEAQIRQGKGDSEIRQELLNSGWHDHAVDVIMHDVHTVDKNIDKLDNFIKVCIDKGMTLDEIKTTLMNVGWREDVVDLALDDFK